jgi:hypothetical protein
MAKKYDNWYVSKVDVTRSNEGRLQALERPLTRPEGSKSLTEGKRLARVSLARMKAMGLENLVLCKPDHKRYSRLLRESNKRNKAKRMTKADIAAIMADGVTEEKKGEV